MLHEPLLVHVDTGCGEGVALLHSVCVVHRVWRAWHCPRAMRLLSLCSADGANQGSSVEVQAHGEESANM